MWRTGKCKCTLCGAEWVGIWPSDLVVGMECYQCGHMTGEENETE